MTILFWIALWVPAIGWPNHFGHDNPRPTHGATPETVQIVDWR